MTGRARRRWPLLRDIATYVLGAALAVHEALRRSPQAQLLGLYGAMMGLPGIFRLEERRRSAPTEDPDELRLERLRRAKETAELEAFLRAMHIALPDGYEDTGSPSPTRRRWSWRGRHAPSGAEQPVEP